MRCKCVLGAFALGFLIVSSNGASAQTVQDSSRPCLTYFAHEAVFTGTVVAINFGEPVVHPEHPEALPYRRRTTRFAVKSAHRGISGNTIEVVANESVPMTVTLPNGEQGVRVNSCETDVRFELGEEYLVYAYRQPEFDNELVATHQTRKIADAGEDLAFIRGLSSAEPGSLLVGSVNRWEQGAGDASVPLPGVRVMVEGPDGKFEATTNLDGRYRVPGLKPGTYTAHVEVPKHLTVEASVESVTLVDRGCGDMSFVASSNFEFTGILIDSTGKVVREISVDLLPADRRNSAMPEPVRSSTDETGRFAFSGLAPGTYVVGIGLGSIRSDGFKYARTFFPGTGNPEDATVIEIEDGKAPESITFKLPKPLGERTLSGVVHFPDGKPVRRAIVSTEVTAYPFRLDGPSVASDELGRFTVRVAEGLDYAIGAFVEEVRGDQRHARAIDVVPSGDVRDIKLVINAPGGRGESPRQIEREREMVREYREREQAQEPED